MTPSLLAALSLAYSLPAIPRTATRASPPRLDAASDVAAWCVASERADAAVTVSGATTMAEALRDFWYVAGAMGASLGDGAAERAISDAEKRSAVNEIELSKRLAEKENEQRLEQIANEMHLAKLLSLIHI